MSRVPVKPHRSFDPRRVGALECDAWVAYYRREWLKLLRASIALTRHTFGLPWPRTLYGTRVAAAQRALAMRHSDRWVAEGCDPRSPLVDQERAALVRL